MHQGRASRTAVQNTKELTGFLKKLVQTKLIIYHQKATLRWTRFLQLLYHSSGIVQIRAKKKELSDFWLQAITHITITQIGLKRLYVLTRCISAAHFNGTSNMRSLSGIFIGIHTLFSCHQVTWHILKAFRNLRLSFFNIKESPFQRGQNQFLTVVSRTV